jgi:ferredoxin
METSMPQILVNDKCTGHGRCYSEAPDLLDCDDEGFVLTDNGAINVEPGQLDEAQAAVKACPERAMALDTTEAPSHGR